jgi:acetylglutamate/LysW-gamma-L-alpha-aminoadipate kinase
MNNLTVLKIGGAAEIGIAPACADIAAQVKAGQRLLIVHGGSDIANTLGTQLGHPPVFVTTTSGHTSRYTDPRTLEIFLMATALLNRRIVAELQRLGVNAVGLSGLDGRLLVAQRKDALRVVENGKRKVLRDDFTGTIQSVNATLLLNLMQDGYTPVIAPLAISGESDPLNVDGDRAAAMIAAATQAHKLVLLTNVAGLYRNYPDPSSLIRQLPQNELPQALDSYAQGRMKRKVLAAQEALQGGVQSVYISDARIDNPISQALAGAGTCIARNEQ